MVWGLIFRMPALYMQKYAKMLITKIKNGKIRCKFKSYFSVPYMGCSLADILIYISSGNVHTNVREWFLRYLERWRKNRISRKEKKRVFLQLVPSTVQDLVGPGFCWSFQRFRLSWVSQPNRLSPDPLKLLICVCVFFFGGGRAVL